MVTQPGTIFLGSKPSSNDTRGFFEKALDITSSILLEPTTFVTNPAKAGRLVRDRRKATQLDPSLGVGTIAETLTATAVAGSLIVNPIGTLRFIAPKTVKGALATTFGIGLVASSKTARDFVLGVVDDPTKFGRETGKVVESVVAGEDTGDIIDTLKTAGVVGAGVAVVGTGLALANKFRSNGKSPSDAVVSTAQAIPSNIVPTATETISSGADPVIAKPEEKKAQSPGVVVNNVINNIPKGL